MKFIENGSLKKILILTFLVAIFLLPPSACALANSPVPIPIPTPEKLRTDPLQQLNRMNDLLHNRLTEEKVQEDFKRREKQLVDDSKIDKAEKSSGKGSDLKFDVKEVQFTETTVLQKKELDGVAAAYVGKKVTLEQLYKMVDDVNELYRKKGYVVCRAFLPEQTIKSGIIKVSLVEGKTGKTKLENGRWTNKNYIVSRTGLKHGVVGNLKDLNRRISIFNATNDAQLSVKLAAGEEQGTTDYILAIDEPDPHYVYIFGDTSGSSSTGIFRYGVGWTISSLLGIRDTLSLNFVKTDFSDSGGVSYSLPITKIGTKFTASISGNGMNPDYKAHALNVLRPRGDSVSYSLGLSQPLYISSGLRIVADLSWSKQYSDSWFRNAPDPESKVSMDNTTNKYSVGLAFTHYGRGVIWYHRHSLTKTDFQHGTSGMDSSYLTYNLNFIRQQALMNGHSLTIKANAQLTPHDVDQLRFSELGFNTSDYFYVGGSGSVRGYSESQLGSEEGFNASVEYAMPFRKYRNITPILFVDYGKVFGAYSKYLNDTQLLSAGLGIRWTSDNGRMSATLWGGFPILRDVNGDKVNTFKVHASFFAQIDDWLAFLFKNPKKPEDDLLEAKRLEEEKKAEEQERLKRQNEINKQAQQLKRNLTKRTVRKQKPRSKEYRNLLKNVAEIQKINFLNDIK